jgi:hypothetical protein
MLLLEIEGARAAGRELTSSLHPKRRKFSVDVSGLVGVKEIERVIKKLELDKEILADQSTDENDEAAHGGGRFMFFYCAAKP